MVWQIEFSPKADKNFEKLDRQAKKKITVYLRDKVAFLENPRSRGEGLTANKAGLWRYRVGDYRIICQIIDDRLVILVIEAGHRRDIYK
ncbi:MAG: type II toxin-antitoxin system RelE/ParE family toxin [Rickettsiales bacterium]